MRKYTLFLSVVVHVAGATALFVVPLLALDSLPPVSDRATSIVARATAIPQPESPAPRRATSTTLASVPLEAPPGFAPDSDQPVDGAGVPSFDPGSGSGEVPVDIGGGGGVIALPPPPAPPVPEARSPMRVGGVVERPRKIVDVAPVYPQLAIASHISGEVMLEAIIAEDGTVRDLKVLRGKPFLDQAAIDAARQWRFTPTRLGGVPISVVMTVTVNFALR